MADEMPQDIPLDVVHRIWQDEDGRCEICHRPLDVRMARLLPRIDDQGKWQRDTMVLVCPDCLAGQPDPLRQDIDIDPVVVEAVMNRTSCLDPEKISKEIIRKLRRYGVLVNQKRAWRWYWVPGWGTFRV
ncbi:MAG: hypothetical protein OWS74_02045, partial [Firmicutes bacterium]|nr:hypothetical protein [Bacillota bacterium]